jgi:hypothetical protein
MKCGPGLRTESPNRLPIAVDSPARAESKSEEQEVAGHAFHIGMV